MKLLRKKQFKFLFGLFITLISLGFIFKNINFLEVKQALSIFNWNYLFAVGLCLIMGYSLRIYRWMLLLCSMNAKVTFKSCQAPFLGSIAINNLLPLRTGDVFRAVVFPNYLEISISNSTSSVIFERLIDLLSLMFYVSIGFIIQKNFNQSNLYKVTSILGGISVLSFIVIYFFHSNLIELFEKIQQGYFHSKISKKAFQMVIEIVSSLAIASKSIYFKRVILLSLCIWFFEAGIFYFLLLGFNLNINMGFALVMMSIVTVSTLAPSSPGYVGPFHLAAYSLVSMLGVTNSIAVSFAILAHLSLWLPTTIVGCGFILLNPDLFKIIFNKNINMDVSYEKI